jgi:hypothetical protein
VVAVVRGALDWHQRHKQRGEGGDRLHHQRIFSHAPPLDRTAASAMSDKAEVEPARFCKQAIRAMRVIVAP